MEIWKINSKLAKINAQSEKALESDTHSFTRSGVPQNTNLKSIFTQRT